MPATRRWLWSACLLLLPAVPVAARPAAPAAAPPAHTVQGVVTQVGSGDTLVLTPADAPPLTVRLRDIDAPESCQPGADGARRALAELALNKPATLRPTGRDLQGRVVGTVTVDAVNLGTRMVEEGHAWSIRTRNDMGPLVKQERMAHALGRGLHGQAGAVMPRDFRRSHGPCATVGASTSPLSGATSAASGQALL